MKIDRFTSLHGETYETEQSKVFVCIFTSAPWQQKKRLLEENQALKLMTFCMECKTKDVSIVYLPCGHLTTCETCAPKQLNCKLCGQFIRGTVKTYRA